MRPLLDSEYIFGIHEPGGEQHMLLAEKPGWIVFSEAIGANPSDLSGVDFRPFSDQHLGVICRLNHGYEPHGTIPHSSQYEAFSRRVANFVRTSMGCKIWIIGNEMNHAVERPGIQIDWSRHPSIFSDRPEQADPFRHGLAVRFNALPDNSSEIRTTRAAIVSQGEVIEPELYARCYRLCANEIHRIPGHEDDLVLVGAVCPWNTQTTYYGNPNGDWVQYFRNTLEAIGPRYCEGFALHAYTHGPEPERITSEDFLQVPFQNYHKEFRVFMDFMRAVPESMRHLPAFITEADQSRPWVDQNSGWVQRAYAEINQWNNQSGHQQIRALCLYHWPLFDKFYIDGKEGVVEDFVGALQHDYRWLDVNAVSPSAQDQSLLRRPLSQTLDSPNMRQELPAVETTSFHPRGVEQESHEEYLRGQTTLEETAPQQVPPGQAVPSTTDQNSGPHPYQIEWLDSQFPEKMIAGQVIEAAITLQNLGTLTWTWGGTHPFRVGYRYYRNRRRLPQRRDQDLRTDVPQDVLPNAIVTIQAQIALPDQPGNYTVEFDMIHEGVTWFKEQDVKPLSRWLTAEAPELTLTSTGDNLDNVGLPVPLFMDVASLLPRSGTYGLRNPDQINHLVISHTGAEPSIGLEFIAQTHVQFGYPGIAYHFVVDATGQIFRVAALEEVAQPDQEWSSRGVNICMAGSFDQEPPSLLQLDAVSRLCAWLCENLSLSPDALMGLGELSESTSPGFTFYQGPNWKALLRRQVQLNVAMLSGNVDNEELRELEEISETLKKKNVDLQAQLKQIQSEREKLRLTNESLQLEMQQLRVELETQTEIPLTGLRLQKQIEKLPRDAERYVVRTAADVELIVINQTGAQPDTSLEQLAEAHRADWPGLLYDFVIEADGAIFQTQPLDQVVGADEAYIRQAINVAFAGTFDINVPTDEQLYAGAQLITWLLERFPNVGIDQIQGLSELTNHTSPGKQWLLEQSWKEMLMASVRRSSGIFDPTETENQLRTQIDELERHVRALNRDALRSQDQKQRLEEENRQLQAELSEQQEVESNYIVPEPAIRDMVDHLPRHPSLQYERRSVDQITHLAIHHTATPPAMSAQRIAELHINSDPARGKDAWPGIGYHYFVHADGSIEQTNPLENISYHVYRHNDYTLGIGFVGSFMNGRIPTSAQLRAGAHLVAWLLQELDISLSRVWGHREFPDNSTVCPGIEWSQGQRWRDLLLRQVEEVQSGIGIKQVRHYMLFWQRPHPGPVARQDLINGLNYITRFRPVVGFSLDEARSAEYVTIIGNQSGITAIDEQILTQSGCKVERIVGRDEEETGRMLTDLVRLGRRFRTFDVDF
ncbi:MAG: N-acetylmuramoyl-L-alanine amidase [Chloroflexota bacterium]